MNIQNFYNDVFGDVRFTIINGRKYAIANDIAKPLGYDQPHKAVVRHCKHTLKVEIPHPQSLTKKLEVNFIPEGDIFRLIVKSKLDKANEFEEWLMDEVLPKIKEDNFFVNEKHITLEQFEKLEEECYELKLKLEEEIKKRKKLEKEKEIATNRFDSTFIYIKQITGKWYALTKAINKYSLDERKTYKYIEQNWTNKNGKLKTSKNVIQRVRDLDGVLYVSELGINTLAKNIEGLRIKEIKDKDNTQGKNVFK